MNYRTTDPETSAVAAAQISIKLTHLQLQFLESLEKSGPSTSNEVASRVAPDNFARRNTIRRRASDLVKSEIGKIREVGTRVCSVSGKLATVYEVCK